MEGSDLTASVHQHLVNAHGVPSWRNPAPAPFWEPLHPLKIGSNLTWIKTEASPLHNSADEREGLCAIHDRSQEGAMRAFSRQRRHRSRPNVSAQSWRRWMARRADQLLEIARLGSDNLEYLTHDRKAADGDLSPVAGGHA